MLDGLRPRCHQVTARVVLPKQHLRQRRSLILRRVRHVQNRRDIRLRPVDCIRKTRHQDHHGLRIHRIHLLDKLLLRQRNHLAVPPLAPITRHRTWQRPSAVGRVVPVVRHIRTARRIVAHHHHRHVGRLRRLHRSVTDLVRSIVHLHSRAHLIPDPIQRRHRMRRRATVPVPVHRIGQRPNHRNRLDRLLLQGQKPARILQQHYRLQRHLFRHRLIPLRIPRLRRILDLRIRHHLRRIQQPQPNRHAELRPQQLVDLLLRHRPILDGRLHFIGIPLKKLIDPSLQTRHYSLLVSRKPLMRNHQLFHRPTVAGEHIYTPLVSNNALQHRIHRHRRAVPRVV